MAVGVFEELWLKRFLAEIKAPTTTPMELLSDSDDNFCPNQRTYTTPWCSDLPPI